MVTAVEDHRDPNKGYTSFSRTRVDVRAITALGYPYDIGGDGTFVIRKHLEQDQINEILKLNLEYGEGGANSVSGSSKDTDQFSTTDMGVGIPGRTQGGCWTDIQLLKVSWADTRATSGFWIGVDIRISLKSGNFAPIQEKI
ncbi:hypothetical protein DL95DRAFT_392166 [Leptodontidium sp. 2 PMI_412]|nr:hypothetical protein DL95DRAFT_392166 [Leptodontidium sp. 2 PMI_412]